MKTSVIIPTFNRARFLGTAVASLIRHQAEVDLDIIIVDDGSTDDTGDVLEELSGKHPEIRMFRQENTGISAARNVGLKNLLPESGMVTFLDSDDVSPSARFSKDLRLFEEDPDLDMTYGEMEMVEGIDPVTLEREVNSRFQRFVGIQLASALFRRSLIDKIGLFDVSLKQGEDADYLFRCFESGCSYVQTDTRCVLYLRHPGSISLSVSGNRKYMAQALVKSIQRRRSNPGLSTRRPSFPLKPSQEMEFSG